VISILEAQERCQKGPLMEDKQFDRKFNLKLREVSAKLNLKHDLAEVIPPPDLADAIFEAALDFAAEIGLYNVDTHRVLQFSRAEIIDTITTRKKEFNLGEGPDMVTVKARRFGDKTLPVRMPGPAGVPITEEYYLPIHVSYAKVPEAQGIVPGCLTSARGFNNTVGTPGEIVTAFQETKIIQEVGRRVGKPGMPIGEAPMSVVSDPAIISAYLPGGYKNTNATVPIQVYPGLKINWHHLNIAAVAQELGIVTWGMAFDVLGAFSRDSIENAIMTIAGELCLLSFTNGNLLYSATATTQGSKHLRAVVPTEALKAMARTRNMNISIVCTPGAAFGACTKSSLYQNALTTFAPVIAGAAIASFGNSGMGTVVNGSTGMEGKMVCETSMAAPSIDDRNEANRIFNNVVKMFVTHMKQNPEQGKTFPECYDVQSVEPTEEYKEIYAAAKKDLRDAGIPLKL